VSSYDWFGSLAFAPLGYVLWGPVSAAIGIDAALWLAFALWVAVMGSLLAVPDIRRLTNDSRDAKAVQQGVVGAP
jgi:hypothetical protein